MRRRHLLGASFALPAVAHAQGNAPGAPKIGFVYPGTRQLAPSRIEAYTSGIRASGYPAPQIEIVSRIADGDPTRVAALTAEVLGLGVSVFIATGPVGMQAARALTRTLPVIATNFEEDPVLGGYAQSLAHPGGNISGVFLDFPDFAGKWIELLRECKPQLARIALIWDQRTGRIQVDAISAAAAPLDLQIEVLGVKEVGDYTAAYAAARERGVDAVILASTPLVPAGAKQIADLALRHKLPSITMFAEFPHAGGLISYGPNLQAANKQIGILVGKVLKGTSPADLPIERPTTFELIVNTKAAEALGIGFSTFIRARADEVIE
jgi:putative ABC transport system substrate-binding protein